MARGSIIGMMQSMQCQLRKFAILLFFLGLQVQQAPDARSDQSSLSIEHPNVRVTIPGRPAAGYMTVKNPGSSADAITAASSPLAKRIELHEHSMDGGIMRMRQVEKVDVPAAGEVAFSSGGYHLMIFGLDASVKLGDALPVILTLNSGKKIEVDFHVGKVGDPNNPYNGKNKSTGKAGGDHTGHGQHKH